MRTGRRPVLFVEVKNKTMEKRIKFIVSDLNGTLVDAMPTYTRVFCDVLKERAGLADPDIAAYSVAHAGTAWDEQFAAVLRAHRQPAEKAPELLSEFCSIVNEEKFSLYPGAGELLRRWRQEGRKVFITSGSATGAMLRRIYELGIYPYVDFLLGFDVYKKSPKHIEMLAERENLSLADFAARAVYFGDGPGDMRIADSCRIYTVGVAQTVPAPSLQAAGADRVIERIGDALAWDFDRLGSPSFDRKSKTC